MRFLTSLLLAATLLFAFAPRSDAQEVQTEWLTSAQYQSYFEANLPGSGLVPIHVEAAEFHGQVYFYARFQRLNGIGWATHHGLSDASFAQRNNQYVAQGYTLVQHQRFVGAGRVHNQGIWHR